MWKHKDLNQSMFNLIRREKVKFAGNNKLKIYGTLSCYSGKRMKKENRVFFNSEDEATSLGFRPCGNCMKTKARTLKKKGI